MATPFRSWLQMFLGLCFAFAFLNALLGHRIVLVCQHEFVLFLAVCRGT